MKDQANEDPDRATWSIAHEVDAIWCSSRAKEFATLVGCGVRAAWEVAIVVRELVTNVLKYAGRGQLVLQHVRAPQHALFIIVEDDGKGIDNVETAFIDGYSEGRMLAPDVRHDERNGLGSGLGAVQRLTDYVVVEKREDGGTRVTARKMVDRPG
jgi:serine/threonine-protein kinase RsbT